MPPKKKLAPTTTESLRNVVKGSLAAIRSNPFAVLHVYQPKRYLQAPQLTDSTKLEDSTEDACPFLDLPGELRNRIYAFCILDSADERARLILEKDVNGLEPTRPYSSTIRGSSWSQHRQHRSQQFRGPLALLLTESQVHKEFLGALAQYAPYHMDLGLVVNLDEDKSAEVLTTAMLQDTFPLAGAEQDPLHPIPSALVINLRCFVDVFIPTQDYEESDQAGSGEHELVRDEADETEGEREESTEQSNEKQADWGNEAGEEGDEDQQKEDQAEWAEEQDIYYAPISTTEETVNSLVVTSDAFESLGQQLKACTPTTDLSIDWSLSPSDYIIMQHQGDDAVNIVYESLVNLVEAMPNLRRYSIRVGRYGMYASRVYGDGWESFRTVRFDHEIMERPDGEWREFLQELQVFH